jgi:hypothetical protein
LANMLLTTSSAFLTADSVEGFAPLRCKQMQRSMSTHIQGKYFCIWKWIMSKVVIKLTVRKLVYNRLERRHTHIHFGESCRSKLTTWFSGVFAITHSFSLLRTVFFLEYARECISLH